MAAFTAGVIHRVLRAGGGGEQREASAVSLRTVSAQANTGRRDRCCLAYAPRRFSIMAMNVLSYGLPMSLAQVVNILHPVPQ
jgi:hypothetical protein